MTIPMPQTHAARRVRVQPLIAALGADAALITSPPNVRYLTGLVSSNAALLLPAEGPGVLATDSRYEEAARRDCPDLELVSERFIEPVLFLGAWWREAGNPVIVDIDVAGGACAGPAAGRFERDAPVPDHLHHTPAVERGQHVLTAGVIDDEENDVVLRRFAARLFQVQPHEEKKFFLFEPAFFYLYRIIFSSTRNLRRCVSCRSFWTSVPEKSR